MLMNKKLSNQKGFTFIELLAIVAIIGILVAIITPNMFRAIENSRVAAAISDYKMIKSAVLNHYADTAKWPDDADPGQDPNLMKNEDDFDNWNGPYLTHWKAEHPWGEEYKYTKDYTAIDDLFGVDKAVVLEIRDLSNAAEVYGRIKEELGEDAVERKCDDVFLLIHKVYEVPECS